MQKILQRTSLAVALLVAAALALLTTGGQAQAADLRLEPNAQTEQIFALPGVLREVQGQPYDTELVSPNGDVYAVVGETPAIEAQLDSARDAQPPIPVKVWGTLYPNGRQTTTPEIVVSAVQVSGPVPEPTPSTPRATVTAPVVNMRAGPSTDYPVIGQLQEGQTCDISGRNRAGTWWNVNCNNNVAGWVAGQLVTVAGSTTNVPILNVAPPPQPAPIPAPPAGCAGWNGTFFANRDLLGAPVVTDCVPTINFNWGTSAPYPQMPPNNWSARFDRAINFGPGNYRFSVVSDDGVRVYVDGERIIDGWREQSPTPYNAERSLSGVHNIRVEYFQAGAGASLVMNIDFISSSGGSGGGTGGGTGGGSGNVPSNAWLASYFNNIGLSGGPVATRQEGRDGGAPLDRDWGNGSPIPGVVGNDNWSATWTGRYYFDAGDYVFQARVDDGVRVYIDGIRVIDAWSDGYKEPANTFWGVGAGDHEIKVEYYERGGTAFVRVNWYRHSNSGGGGGSGGGSGGGVGGSLDD